MGSAEVLSIVGGTHPTAWVLETLSWRRAQNVPDGNLDGNTEYLSAADDMTPAMCWLRETLSQSRVALFFHWKGRMAELGQGMRVRNTLFKSQHS